MFLKGPLTSPRGYKFRPLSGRTKTSTELCPNTEQVFFLLINFNYKGTRTNDIGSFLVRNSNNSYLTSVDKFDVLFVAFILQSYEINLHFY